MPAAPEAWNSEVPASLHSTIDAKAKINCNKRLGSDQAKEEKKNGLNEQNLSKTFKEK